MEKSLSMEDIAWESPEEVIEEYFDSDEQAFEQWIFKNLKQIFECPLVGHVPYDDWQRLRDEIVGKQSEEFYDAITQKLNELRNSESLESYNELKRLKGCLIRDCELYKWTNMDAVFKDRDFYTTMEHVDYAFLKWGGKNYLVYIQGVYDMSIKKIDAMLIYHEYTHPEWKKHGVLSPKESLTLSFQGNKPGSTQLGEQTIRAGQQSDTPNDNPIRQKDITMKRLALIYFYRGIPINGGNCDDIALKNGYTSKSSGAKLKRAYEEIIRKPDRVGSRGTRAKNSKHLKDLQYVLDHLQDDSLKKKLLSDIEEFEENSTE